MHLPRREEFPRAQAQREPRQTGSMLRILQVIASLAPRYGGPSVACPALARALVRLGATVTVFTTNVDGPRKYRLPSGTTEQRDGVQYEYFDGWTWPAEYKFSPALARALFHRVAAFDVVHIYSMYIFSATAAAWACRRRGVPYLLQPHGTLDPYLRRRHALRKRAYEWLVERRNFRHAAAVLFNTPEEHRLAEAWLNHLVGSAEVPERAVVPVGVEEHWFAPSDPAVCASLLARFPELSGKQWIIFFGRLSFKKGLDVLARAFAEVARRNPQAHLVVAGPDTEGLGAQLRAWLQQSQVLEKASFVGVLDSQQSRALLGAGTVFVLPSYSENFGQAVAEAMACGLPVVISDRVNLCSAVAQAGAGVVVPCESAATAAAIEQILRQPAQARAMGERGRRLVAERYNGQTVAGQMLALYQRVALRGSRARAGFFRDDREQPARFGRW